MFQPGQKVICVDGFVTYHPKKGVIYTVVHSHINMGAEVLDIRTPGGVVWAGWFATRFQAYGSAASASVDPAPKKMQPSRANKPENKSLSRAIRSLVHQGRTA